MASTDDIFTFKIVIVLEAIKKSDIAKAEAEMPSGESEWNISRAISTPLRLDQQKIGRGRITVLAGAPA